MDMEKQLTTAELLQKLFNVTTSFTYKGFTFYLKLPIEQVYEDTRKKALLESRKLRKELRDPNSNASLLYLDEIEDFSRDQLIQALVNTTARKVARTYVINNPKPALPKLSDFPTQEEQEEYVAAEEERDRVYREQLQQYLESWEKEYRDQLQSWSVEQLRSTYRQARVDELCETEFQRWFEYALLAYSVYLDEKCTQLAFTPEDIRQTSKDFLDQALQALSQLQFTDEELKK